MEAGRSAIPAGVPEICCPGKAWPGGLPGFSRGHCRSAADRRDEARCNGEGPSAAELARTTTSGQGFRSWLAGSRTADEKAADDSVRIIALQRQWHNAEVKQRLEDERKSAPYQQKLRDFYTEVQKTAPQDFPYDYDKFQQLNAAYAKGETAFITALGPRGSDNATGKARLQADFEQFKQRELAEKWWANDPVAVLVRHHAEADLDSLAGMVGQRTEDLVKLFLGLPAQLATVLLLSFFITVDFPSLARESAASNRAACDSCSTISSGPGTARQSDRQGIPGPGHCFPDRRHADLCPWFFWASRTRSCWAW